MSTLQKIEQLRALMSQHDIKAYIIPSSDPHQSEYVAEYWAARAWISGFTGSSGTAVVSLDSAGVWTDSRYFIQADAELKDSGFDLYKVYNHSSPQFIDWLLEHLKEGDQVGCDGRLFSKKQLESYEKKLRKLKIGINTKLDLVSEVWINRPALPSAEIYNYPIEYAGESRASKIKRIREKIKGAGATCHLISTLDDIAWTFNIRGSDVNFNPVAYAYAIISEENATLYLDKNKVEDVLTDMLSMDNIDLKPYEEIWKDLNQLDANEVILIDENTISYSLFRAINSEQKINQRLPSIHLKSIKNVVEISHFRNVMVKDGVALVKFYRWLEKELTNGPSEYDLAKKIACFRSEQAGYVSESFDAIVGFRENGAIVHYRPSEDQSSTLEGGGLLLIDSGGQYMDGTTDITRTISLGAPSHQEKDAYTRVLKGNIALDMAVFPEGTLGVQLDTLARVYLWHKQMNFLHGTGHGVGFFLNVHEGPQGFYPGNSTRSRSSIDEHMITTNEPGYYEEGKFGIRIENCLLAVKAGQGFLKFETLTLFPIDTQLIEMSMLTKDEVEWLNQYHRKVFDRLSPHLNNEESLWLLSKCVDI